MTGSDDDKKDEEVDETVNDVVEQLVGLTDDDGKGSNLPKKRRLCRYPGCTKVIKSQGHCQRHGARAKRCKMDGCDKQAQVCQYVVGKAYGTGETTRSVAISLVAHRLVAMR